MSSHKGCVTITVRSSGLKVGLNYIWYSSTDYTFEFRSASQMIYYINCLTSNPFNNLRVCQNSDIWCYCLLFKGKLFVPFWCIDLSSLLFPGEILLLNQKKYSTVTLLWFSEGRNCFNMITIWRITLNLGPLPWSAPVMLFNLKLSLRTYKQNIKYLGNSKMQEPSLSTLKLKFS